MTRIKSVSPYRMSVRRPVVWLTERVEVAVEPKKAIVLALPTRRPPAFGQKREMSVDGRIAFGRIAA